mmetsp:Transcript_18294/g.31691  ORF Transcript_18294/g.31691 Transcript_18294/m.31691 type:complete len:239 (+) Transcript_18294:341-1057(+)
MASDGEIPPSDPYGFGDVMDADAGAYACPCPCANEVREEEDCCCEGLGDDDRAPPVVPNPGCPRNVPLRIARSRSCCLFNESRSSGTGTKSSSTASLARLSCLVATASSVSASKTTCNGSLNTCSHPGFPRTSFSLSLRMEPLPRIMILQPVSRSSVLSVAPLGPKSLPTKLYSGYFSAGTGILTRFLTIGPPGMVLERGPIPILADCGGEEVEVEVEDGGGGGGGASGMRDEVCCAC